MVETIVVVGIITVLLVLVVKYGTRTIEKSEAVRCAQNLRSLHTSLAAYVQDRGHWPQEPEGLWQSNDGDAYEDWWIKELEPYGAPEEVWRCPSIQRKIVNKNKTGRPKMHYSPTKFDNKALTPYKWSTQPWLVEIGNLHGVGALICFPDGSVKTMNEVTGAR